MVETAGQATARTHATLDRADVVTTQSARHSDAAAGVLDRLPTVLEHLEHDVLPVLSTLDRVGPDLHEVLEVVEDLRRVITGLPGIGLLRKRGEDEPPPPVEGNVHGDGLPVPHRPRRTSQT